MIIINTGFWLGVSNRRNSYHHQATQALPQVKEPLITTWLVITETSHFLLKRLGNNTQGKFILNLSREAFAVFDLSPVHSVRLQEPIHQYQNLPMDLADASLIILAEDLGHERILSVNQRDFNPYRWKNTHPFENLMSLSDPSCIVEGVVGRLPHC